MKQFDPSVGWVQSPSSVHHFNREGNRLNVARIQEGQEPQTPATPAPEDTVPPAVRRMREATARPANGSLPAPAETAGMVRELFERLDDADASRGLMARVADNLKALEDLAVKKGQLERVLAGITQEMAQMRAQVQGDLDAARDSEDRNLKLRQYRRELLDALARRLPAADKP